MIINNYHGRPGVTLDTDTGQLSDGGKAIDRVEWNDDMYEEYLQKYASEPWFKQYESMLRNNPWLASKQAQFSTDPFTSLFNYNGARDKYYSDMRANALDWLDKRAEQYREEYYNSASQQVAREQAAGLNSDLNGSVDAGAASENDELSQPPLVNGTSEYGMQIAQAGMSFISGILSFGKQIQDLNIGAQTKIAAELSAGSSARDYALNELAAVIGTNPSEDDVKSWLTVVSENKLKAFSGFSRGTRKYLQHWIDRYHEGNLPLDSLVSELRNKVATNNRSTAEVMSSPWYSPDLNEYINNVSEHFMKYVSLQNELVAKVGVNKAAVEDVRWNDEGFQNLYGETLGSEMSSRNEYAKSSSISSQLQREMNKTWDSLMKAVEGDGKHWYNTIGMILIMALRSQLSQPLHFGFSSSNSTSMGRYGVSESSSRGFHF